MNEKIRERIKHVLEWHHRFNSYDMMSIYSLLIEASTKYKFVDGCLLESGRDYTIKEVNQCIKEMIKNNELVQNKQKITFKSMEDKLIRYNKGERFKEV